MTRARRAIRLVLSTAFVVATVAVPVSGQTSDENLARLAGIPREQRAELAAKLAQFDALDRETRDAVTRLDGKLAALPSGERSNHLAVLRRYHLWLQSLPETLRAEINALPPTQRLAAVMKAVAEQPPRSTPSPLHQRVTDLGDPSPYDAAGDVRLWQTLSPTEKAELSKALPPVRSRRVTQLTRERNIKPVPRPTRSNDELVFDRALKGGLKRFWDAPKKDDAFKTERLKARLIEHHLFLENPPARVTPERLFAFAADLPPWVESLYDPLPPDEARRRLTIVYRLLYPSPAEYQPPRPAAPSVPKAPAAKPQPAPAKPGGGSAPF